MAELKASEITETTAPVINPEDYMYVKIPQADLFDQPHPGVRLNRYKFEAGRTYRVRGEVGKEVEERLQMFHNEQVRLLRPNADRRSLTEVNKGSQWTNRGGGTITNLDGGLGSMGGANERIITVDL